MDVEIYITRKKQTTAAVIKKKMGIELIGGRSALNDSKKAGIQFRFKDSIGIDILLTIISSTPFSVFIALQKSDSCSNYEAMSRLDCDTDCMYQECVLQLAEPDGYYPNIMYCCYICQQTSTVLIRRMVQPGMQYLPHYFSILELAALAI